MGAYLEPLLGRVAVRRGLPRPRPRRLGRLPPPGVPAHRRPAGSARDPGMWYTTGHRGVRGGVRPVRGVPLPQPQARPLVGVDVRHHRASTPCWGSSSPASPGRATSAGSSPASSRGRSSPTRDIGRRAGGGVDDPLARARRGDRAARRPGGGQVCRDDGALLTGTAGVTTTDGAVAAVRDRPCPGGRRERGLSGSGPFPGFSRRYSQVLHSCHSSPMWTSPVDNRVRSDAGSGRSGAAQRQRVVIPKPLTMRPKPTPRFHLPSDWHRVAAGRRCRR